jgi:hypothetical protein
MGKSQTTAKNKYNAKSYDRISVTVKKGVKDDWKSEAEKQGLSLNAFIEQAVNQMITVADDNDAIENTLAFNEDTEVSSEAEQNIQELSETDILNNAFMKIAESCQKLLSAHLDLIDLFPNKKLCSPYRETISNYFWAIMNENIEQLLYRINDDEVKTDVHSILNAVNREVNIFKEHIDSNDLEEYLKQFNELMNLNEDE